MYIQIKKEELELLLEGLSYGSSGCCYSDSGIMGHLDHEEDEDILDECDFPCVGRYLAKLSREELLACNNNEKLLTRGGTILIAERLAEKLLEENKD